MNAVITGDIIQSTRLAADTRLRLIKQIQYALKTWETDFTFSSEFFQGDSFQCLLQHPGFSLRVSLLLKTFIRSLNAELFALGKKSKATGDQSSAHIMDARIAIGIGEAKRGTTMATSNGTAFILSGHLLDNLKKGKQSFSIATDDDYHAELSTASALIDALMSKTTAFQCEVINLKLLYYNESEIAKKLKINQSAVNQRSKSGNWTAINTMVGRFEKIYQER
jgi:hypothetical protein